MEGGVAALGLLAGEVDLALLSPAACTGAAPALVVPLAGMVDSVAGTARTAPLLWLSPEAPAARVAALAGVGAEVPAAACGTGLL
jgi:hypothetical protein